MVVSRNQLEIVQDHDSYYEGKYQFLDRFFYYYKGQLFTGKSEDYHSNLNPKQIVVYKMGLINGLLLDWYENGQAHREVTYKNGWKHGPFKLWAKNGQKIEQGENKDGRISTIQVWKPSGQICPITDLKDGSGIVVRYNEFGEKTSSTSYDNGWRILSDISDHRIGRNPSF